MQPRRHRPRLEADVGGRHDASAPTLAAPTRDQTPTLISLDLEPRTSTAMSSTWAAHGNRTSSSKTVRKPASCSSVPYASTVIDSMRSLRDWRGTPTRLRGCR